MSRGTVPEFCEALKPTRTLIPPIVSRFRTRDLDGVDRRHQPEVAAFPDHHPPGKPIDAGEGHVEESDNPDRRWLDHVFEKTRVIAGPGAAGVDKSGAASARQNRRIDAERRAAPIDMRVQINEPRRDDEPRDVADRLAFEAVPEARRTAVVEANIRDGVDSLGRVDDAPAAQHEIKGHVVALAFRPLAGKGS